MHGSDQIFHLPQDLCFLLVPRLKEHIQFHASQNIHTPAAGLLQPADLSIILFQFHPDIRIHMPRKAQMRKAELHGPLSHLLRRIRAVAENRMSVKITSEHVMISPLAAKNVHGFNTDLS